MLGAVPHLLKLRLSHNVYARRKKQGRIPQLRSPYCIHCYRLVNNIFLGLQSIGESRFNKRERLPSILQNRLFQSPFKPSSGVGVGIPPFPVKQILKWPNQKCQTVEIGQGVLVSDKEIVSAKMVLIYQHVDLQIVFVELESFLRI